MARSRYDEADDEPDDFDESDEYNAEHDYDPDDLETYPAGLYNDDGPPTVPCPHCRADIFEDSEHCPSCGQYLTGENEPRSRSRAWLILMILALLAAAIWVSGG